MTHTVLATLPSGHRIARARREDLPTIIALLVDDPLGSTREDPSDPAYVRAFETLDADPAHLLVVVLDEGDQVAATMQVSIIPGLSRRGATRAQLEGVRVADAARGTGVGAAMVEWSIDYAREQGANLMQLTTDKARTRAHTFYERLGFVASHEGMKAML
ncbi:GNAT family N-acetyltransferase [Demetria terragena]|uniref:GNAT family N-acetyltransferase n=1 Tax=Demetria terragena TaxID=63959 RepID=UPI000377F281|nr:GNAT family N-acetyltransferase [Demetria terragena]